MANSFSKSVAVFSKEIKSEFRTRYAISSTLLFILTTITMIVFSLAHESLSPAFTAGIIWVIMFFTAMTGLAKSFVSEEERGTGFLLILTASTDSVYFGKLFFNLVLGVALNAVAVILFLIFSSSVKINSPLEFSIGIFLGSIGISCATTIISAIIAKANTKNALFPVLSFPILLPLIIIGIMASAEAIEGTEFLKTYDNFNIMIAYSGVITVVSYFLFKIVWKD
ncbi:MAG: heme exporter protein CcmB [Candidatus Kapabacteria bacterium]|nr:heme exporter protein CcmB [Candidatus Kapabacteria bacterium]